jgi:pimeloyl-ACP methyl ester carboxylesterase
VPFVTTSDNIRLYYEALGQGEPLLLVGGRNSDHHIWNLIRKDFAKHYQVIVYDQRGTGQSDKPEQPPYSTRGFARDAIAILDTLQISKAHVYGVSMGGAIGQWLGIDYPDRIGALILACSTAGISHGVRPSEETRAIMASGNGSKSMKLMFSKIWGLNQLQFFYSVSESVKNPMPAYAEELHALASREHDAWDLLPGIKSPTLILQGRADPVCPSENASLLAGRIPDAEFHFFERGRHMFFIEFRQQVNRLVLDFLKRYPLKR